MTIGQSQLQITKMAHLQVDKELSLVTRLIRDQLVSYRDATKDRGMVELVVSRAVALQRTRGEVVRIDVFKPEVYKGFGEALRRIKTHYL